jgi:hypothetical protein
MSSKIRRPRQPQKRKKETWSEYKIRWAAWAAVYSINPTGYGPAADLDGMRNRLTGHTIISPGDAFNGDMITPFASRQSIKCNAAGLAWLERGGAPDPSGPKTCPYLGDSPCLKPNPDPLRQVGTITATKHKPVAQMYLFEEDTPRWELGYNPCCLEGLYLCSSELKKSGYTVKIELGESDEIKREYEILFGLIPCREDSDE